MGTKMLRINKVMAKNQAKIIFSSTTNKNIRNI